MYEKCTVKKQMMASFITKKCILRDTDKTYEKNPLVTNGNMGDKELNLCLRDGSNLNIFETVLT